MESVAKFFFFVTAPSFEAREAYWHLNNQLGIFHARSGGLLDHPYFPDDPSSATSTEEHQGGSLTHYWHPMSNCVLCILFPYCYIVCHKS